MEKNLAVGLFIDIHNPDELIRNLALSGADKTVEIMVGFKEEKREFTCADFLSRLGFEVEK